MTRKLVSRLWEGEKTWNMLRGTGHRTVGAATGDQGYPGQSWTGQLELTCLAIGLGFHLVVEALLSNFLVLCT